MERLDTKISTPKLTLLLRCCDIVKSIAIRSKAKRQTIKYVCSVLSLSKKTIAIATVAFRQPTRMRSQTIVLQDTYGVPTLIKDERAMSSAQYVSYTTIHHYIHALETIIMILCSDTTTKPQLHTLNVKTRRV